MKFWPKKFGGKIKVTSAPNFESKNIFDLATLEWETSPIMAILRPLKQFCENLLPVSCKIVKVSSKLCVGCSFVPSPALIMAVFSLI